MANALKKKLAKMSDALSNARKKAREVRESKTTGKIVRGLAVAGTAAASGGMLDGAINMLPGGHIGHGDYTKAPSLLRYKRFLIPAALAGATAVMLDGVEGNIAFPLAALAGRGVHQHEATFRKKTGARTPEELAKDIGPAEAAKVAAANGYPQA